MKRFWILLLAVSLLLAGCASWMDGYHYSVTPYKGENADLVSETPTVSTYSQLRQEMVRLVEEGLESGIIILQGYTDPDAERDAAVAVQYVTECFPLGVYAVSEMTYEMGTNSGRTALAVTVQYRCSRSELLGIGRAENMEQARSAIADALNRCNTGITMLVSRYEEMDFAQFVEDYADENPELVIERPLTTAAVYPDSGDERIVELKFTYQTSREVLRSMQSQVKSVFSAAETAVEGLETQEEKCGALCGLLLERTRNVQSSITPSYSLLTYGVGDSRAISVVFAALCRRAGLECHVVSGTRDGESWFWNIVRLGEDAYHLDLASAVPNGVANYRGDVQMVGYVWDYSAYPACEPFPVPEIPQETDPEESTEPTEPEEPVEPTEPEETTEPSDPSEPEEEGTQE